MLVLFETISTQIQISIADDTNDNNFYHHVLTEEDLVNKHESLRSCLTYDLEPDEYEMYPNKTVFVSAYNRTYEKAFYVLLSGDILRICAPPKPPLNLGLAILKKLSLVITCASLFFLFILAFLFIHSFILAISSV
ncbi:hypothetical protein AVEN_183746-1 [Araneus ventricosus]|uniref:Uncharacterized protein n=1 Tax=Araneus ventricosus TaxID=182803 RepID=A0A4Y2PTQ3_ARAVE|nr:hypothetical protein AVEN_183746-1 [Araneus ventricosus]